MLLAGWECWRWRDRNWCIITTEGGGGKEQLDDEYRDIQSENLQGDHEEGRMCQTALLDQSDASHPNKDSCLGWYIRHLTAMVLKVGSGDPQGSLRGSHVGLWSNLCGYKQVCHCLTVYQDNSKLEPLIYGFHFYRRLCTSCSIIALPSWASSSTSRPVTSVLSHLLRCTCKSHWVWFPRAWNAVYR